MEPNIELLEARIAPAGIITVTYDGAGAIPQLGANNLVVLSPYINTVALATASSLSGNIDWACTSAGNTTAVAQSMAAPIVGTGVATKYVPSNCK